MTRTNRNLVSALLAVFILGLGGSLLLADNRDPPPPPTDWQSNELRDHPLVGKIWSTKSKEFVTSAQLGTQLALARFVLLGEVHDNADHHLWQAWAIRTISKLRGSRIVEGAPQIDIIAMEMVRTDQYAALDKFYGRDVLVPRPRKPRDFARMLKWSKSGWPDFKIYAPIIKQALYEQISIVPASVSRKFTQRLSKEGESALAAGELSRLALDKPLGGGLDDDLAKDIRESHCAMLPDKAIPRVSFIQRFRDAIMADTLLSVASGKGGILIAGNGHTRTDRGVPVYLARRGVETDQVVSLAFVEVSAGETDPGAYVKNATTGQPTADFAVFTPRTARTDPCEQMRQQMQRHKARKSKAGEPAE
ncbi:MAG: ChaN family lipoprotein [Alphaproteobacteria bacterium]|nr:ChaN family lipoprotein [Alphaproteobacteria bacterium]